jgi:hypothetical protein
MKKPTYLNNFHFEGNIISATLAQPSGANPLENFRQGSHSFLDGRVGDIHIIGRYLTWRRKVGESLPHKPPPQNKKRMRYDPTLLPAD